MQPNKRSFVIGVTGNIGSGKSTFCSELEKQGLCVYSADLLAKQRLHDPQVIMALVKHFSEQIMETAHNGKGHEPKINHQKLAEIVFGDPSELAYLNSLIHPLVLKDMDEIVATSDEEYVVFEVPLLFEARLQECFDYIMLVYTSPELRRARILSRDHDTQTIRDDFQISDEDKRRSVDLVICNDATKEDLQNQARDFISSIRCLKKKDIRPFSSTKSQ